MKAFKITTKLFKSLDMVGVRVPSSRAFVAPTLSKWADHEKDEEKAKAYEKVAEAASAVKEGVANLNQTCNVVKDSVKTVTKNVAGKATETLVDKVTEKIKETVTSSK